MKQKLLILFVCFGLVVFAQQKKADSLQLLLKASKNDIDRVKNLNLVADAYKTIDIKQVNKYANEALDLSKKIDFKVEEAHAYLNLGNGAIIEGNYKKAFDYFWKAQQLLENENQQLIDVKKYLAKTYGSIGVVFSEQSNYSKALQFYLNAVNIYEKLNDKEKCAKLYNNIGVVYKSQKNNLKALEFFFKAQKEQELLKDENLGVTYTNIANSYMYLKDFTKAFQYYQKAQIILTKTNNHRAKGEFYNNLGLYYEASKNSNKAESSWNNAILEFEAIQDKFGVADTYLYLGNYFYAQNNFDKAIENASKCLQLAQTTQVLEQQVLSRKLLSESYSKKENPEMALQNLKLYLALNDSLNNVEHIRKGVEAEMNFDFEKRMLLQKEELQKKEILLQEASKRNQMQLFYAILIALLLFGIGFLIYSKFQLKKRLTLQKELAEYEQKALHLQMNPHFVFNCLGSISSFIVQNGKESALKYLAKFSKLMRLTLEYSKESLIPIDKEIESLQNYLELEQLRFNNKFEFAITKSNDIEDDVALPPLLLQPFVENAVIHGVIPSNDKGLIKIAFSLEQNNLRCEITDNGIGMEYSKQLKQNSVLAHKSMAVDIIKRRLEVIASSTKKEANISLEEMKEDTKILGTKVTLKLPIQYINDKK